MNRFLYIIIATIFISSCEVIEGPYMTGTIDPIDTTNNQYVKNILIEDFTRSCSFNLSFNRLN